jgi:hypothetical protein
LSFYGFIYGWEHNLMSVRETAVIMLNIIFDFRQQCRWLKYQLFRFSLNLLFIIKDFTSESICIRWYW